MEKGFNPSILSHPISSFTKLALPNLSVRCICLGIPVIPGPKLCQQCLRNGMWLSLEVLSTNQGHMCEGKSQAKTFSKGTDGTRQWRTVRDESFCMMPV